MKIATLIISVFFLIILADSCFAACPEPNILTYDKCTDGCPDPVQYTEKYSRCVNDCLGMWNKMQDDHYACTKAEREAAEKKKLEEDNKLRGIEEAKIITVSTVEGMLWLTNPEGLVENIVPTNLLDIMPGSILRSDPDSSAVVTIKEGSKLQLGPDSQFTYIGGEPIDKFDKMLYKYYVSKGRVRYNSANQDVKYEVHTSRGTVVNRQTDFIVEVDPVTDSTAIYLYEGVLDVNTTKGETFVLNTGEIMTIDQSDNAVKSRLIIEDWDGMVNSIETGAEFIPSSERQTETETTESGEQKADDATYPILIAIIVLIALGAVMVKRKKSQKS
jgi:hypothetical protein